MSAPGDGSRSPDPEDLHVLVDQEIHLPIFNAWLEALRDCYMLAKGERLGELRGRRVKLLDDRGLHNFSLAWGRVLAFEMLLPELQSARLSDPPSDQLQIRRLGQRDAENVFYDEIRAKGADAWT